MPFSKIFFQKKLKIFYELSNSHIYTLCVENTLGFYFIIYQSQLNGYVKCFIDGSEDPTFFSIEDFLHLGESITDSHFQYALGESVYTTSFYIWDVQNFSIKRLQPSFEPSYLGEEFLKLKNSVKEQSKSRGYSESTKIEVFK